MQFVCEIGQKYVPLHSQNKKALLEDPLAQLVEHNTFNVGVLGSSPKRITKGHS